MGDYFGFPLNCRYATPRFHGEERGVAKGILLPHRTQRLRYRRFRMVTAYKFPRSIAQRGGYHALSDEQAPQRPKVWQRRESPRQRLGEGHRLVETRRCSEAVSNPIQACGRL